MKLSIWWQVEQKKSSDFGWDGSESSQVGIWHLAFGIWYLGLALALALVLEFLQVWIDHMYMYCKDQPTNRQTTKHEFHPIQQSTTDIDSMRGKNRRENELMSGSGWVYKLKLWNFAHSHTTWRARFAPSHLFTLCNFASWKLAWCTGVCLLHVPWKLWVSINCEAFRRFRVCSFASAAFLLCFVVVLWAGLNCSQRAKEFVLAHRNWNWHWHSDRCICPNYFLFQISLQPNPSRCEHLILVSGVGWSLFFLFFFSLFEWSWFRYVGSITTPWRGGV